MFPIVYTFSQQFDIFEPISFSVLKTCDSFINIQKQAMKSNFWKPPAD